MPAGRLSSSVSDDLLVLLQSLYATEGSDPSAPTQPIIAVTRLESYRGPMLDAGEAAEAVAVLDETEAHLAAVEASLARLDQGVYGRCETCGATIANTALAVEPTRARCEEHAGA